MRKSLVIMKDAVEIAELRRQIHILKCKQCRDAAASEANRTHECDLGKSLKEMLETKRQDYEQHKRIVREAVL